MKKAGQLEEFNKEKLVQSILKAGASEETARKIADAVDVREGMSTSEIKSRVLARLRTENPEAAATYETYKKPTA